MKLEERVFFFFWTTFVFPLQQHLCLLFFLLSVHSGVTLPAKKKRVLREVHWNELPDSFTFALTVLQRLSQLRLFHEDSWKSNWKSMADWLSPFVIIFSLVAGVLNWKDVFFSSAGIHYRHCTIIYENLFHGHLIFKFHDTNHMQTYTYIYIAI